MAIKESFVSRELAMYSDICRLMVTAFPKNEQIPMWILKLLALRKNFNFRAFYDEGQFCGILYTIENSKYTFVLYLAINDKIRSKGYGSQILGWLKDHTPKIIVLNVESVNQFSTNVQQREKRIAFYQRNGIADTGYTFADRNERYSVLASDCEHFNALEYERMLRCFSFGLYRIKTEQR